MAPYMTAMLSRGILRPCPAAELLAVQAALQRAFPQCTDLSSDPGRSITAFTPHLSLGQWRTKADVQAAAAHLAAGWSPLSFEVAGVGLIARQGFDDHFRWAPTAGHGCMPPSVHDDMAATQPKVQPQLALLLSTFIQPGPLQAGVVCAAGRRRAGCGGRPLHCNCGRQRLPACTSRRWQQQHNRQQQRQQQWFPAVARLLWHRGSTAGWQRVAVCIWR